jgi:hypothetical protein
MAPEPEDNNALVVICAWCVDAPEQTASARAHGRETTHSICAACFAREMATIAAAEEAKRLRS